MWEPNIFLISLDIFKTWLCLSVLLLYNVWDSLASVFCSLLHRLSSVYAYFLKKHTHIPRMCILNEMPRHRSVESNFTEAEGIC